MASFEKLRGGLNKSSDPVKKLPLKRFEPAIYRFTKIALPTDLDRLERHKYNIEKYVKWKNWAKLDVERINAERTIKLLKANIQEMDNIREQVIENDVEDFDTKIKDVKEKALKEISILQTLISKSLENREEPCEKLGKKPSLSPTTSKTSDIPLLADSGKAEHGLPMRDKDSRPSSSNTKANLQRFDVSLRTFTNITIPTALERLRKHRINMEKYCEEHLWQELNAEQINARISVQHLKENMKGMEATRRQVPLQSLSEFDERVGPSYTKAIAAIESFMKFQSNYKRDDLDMTVSEAIVIHQEGKEHSKLMNQVQINPDETSVKSWDDLHKGLVELNELIHDFSHMIHEQESTVDTIEANIENAQANVHEATQELGHAAKLKTVLLPAVGAVVGGVIGGPVGLLAGFKAGTVFAVGGGVLGYTATSIIKNIQEEAVNSELEKLSDNPKDEHKVDG
ncbi:syntaxin-17-like isoform X2 [Xenia sp. Carnegie-2017]|uniref:syntaxin-17-like isoform X2 n=1 Tax=Xenia sp. Carnegie-2017 TaxID=2897299 RepID=UPI001F03D4F7|nr:syntaxin-17-like isoform X2 [Xenia sp. Carnegie-2017]